jgi:hypothetical protein
VHALDNWHFENLILASLGRGKVTYVEEDSGERSSLEVERGDVYNLEQGSTMFIQSYPNATRQRLRIYAIFSSEGINADDPSVSIKPPALLPHGSN